MELNQMVTEIEQGLFEFEEKLKQIGQYEDQILELQKRINILKKGLDNKTSIRTYSDFKELLLKKIDVPIKKSKIIELYSRILSSSKSMSLNYLSITGHGNNKLKNELVSAAFNCLLDSHPVELFNSHKHLQRKNLERLHEKYHEFYMVHLNLSNDNGNLKIYMRAFNKCAYSHEWKMLYEQCVIPYFNHYNVLESFKNTYNFPQEYMDVIDSNLIALKLST